MATLDNRKELRRVAVLDLGSNTILLLVQDRDQGTLLDRARITRLSEGVFERQSLGADARRRTTAAVADFVALAREHGSECTVAVGTEALRRASDGLAYLDEIAAANGLDSARILDGEEEARFTIEASRRAVGAGELAAVDVGGGSTEFAWTRGEQVLGRSLPLGSVRLTEACQLRHPTSPAQLAELRRRAREELVRLGDCPGLSEATASAVVALAGTATTLAALDQALDPYRADRVEGRRLSREALNGWIDRLAALDLEARRALPGLEPGRADVIVAGLAILDESLSVLGVSEFQVSGQGVRHGVALSLLEDSALLDGKHAV